MKRTQCSRQCSRWMRLLPLLFLVFANAATAESVLITFDEASLGLSHGDYVSNQYESLFGITVAADNPNRADPDFAMIFDSQFTGSTTDDDLLGPPVIDWQGGNLAASNTQLGNLLILSEDDDMSDPDDEGKRPAGKFMIDFMKPIDSFGFDLVDIENVEVGGGYFAAFKMGNTTLATVGFSEFTNSSSLFYDATVDFGGDNTANRIQPITAADLTAFTGTTINHWDRVEIQFGGSGATDNWTVNVVPTPTAALAAIPLFAMLGITRPQRDRD